MRTLQHRQGLQVGCPEEIAYDQGWITADELQDRARFYAKTDYGRYLSRLLAS